MDDERKEQIIADMVAVWTDMGCDWFGFQFVTLYTPNDELEAITIAKSEEYINKVAEINMEE